MLRKKALLSDPWEGPQRPDWPPDNLLYFSGVGMGLCKLWNKEANFPQSRWHQRVNLINRSPGLFSSLPDFRNCLFHLFYCLIPWPSDRCDWIQLFNVCPNVFLLKALLTTDGKVLWTAFFSKVDAWRSQFSINAERSSLSLLKSVRKFPL